MADRVKEKLIELLGADVCKHDCCDDCEYGQNRDACIAFLKESMADHLISNGVVISNLETTTMQQWIPVTERLPENGKKVLVYCKENKNDYEIGAYSDTYRGFFVRQTCYENITHWMHLPQPPKGE